MSGKTASIRYTHYIVIRTEQEYEELKKYITYLKDLENSVMYFDSYLDFFERGQSIFGDNRFLDKDKASIIYFNNRSEYLDIGWDRLHDRLKNYTGGSLKEYKTAREWVLDVPEAAERLLKFETKLGSLF